MLAKALLIDFAVPLASSVPGGSPKVGDATLYRDGSNWGFYYCFEEGVWQFIAGERYGIENPFGIIAPLGKGEWFVDTVNNIVYKAKDVTESDWIATSAGGGGGSS